MAKTAPPPGSARLAFAVPWLESVTALADGTLTIRFADGRTVDSITLLNDKGDVLAKTEVRVMPGEALVLRTRELGDVAELAVPIPTEDGDGICSTISRSAQGNAWVFLRRVPGRITDEQVCREFGGGTFRIDVLRVLDSGQTYRVSRREVLYDASRGTYSNR